MMRVRSKLSYPFAVSAPFVESIEPRREYDLPDELARQLMAAGMVEPVEPPAPPDAEAAMPRRPRGAKES